MMREEQRADQEQARGAAEKEAQETAEHHQLFLAWRVVGRRLGSGASDGFICVRTMM